MEYDTYVTVDPVLEIITKRSNTMNAFLTDITPTLLYLLGHRPIVKNPVFGRPLFTATARERAEYLRETYLVGCSYSAIYGTISNDGRWLFTSDLTSEKDFLFDLATDPRGIHNIVTPRVQLEQRTVIREQIDAIGRFYNYSPAPY
jgi:hypothetical protein